MSAAFQGGPVHALALHAPDVDLTDTARKLFEQRVRTCGYDVARNDNGLYRWAAVRDMWRGWQLALRTDPNKLT